LTINNLNKEARIVKYGLRFYFECIPGGSVIDKLIVDMKLLHRKYITLLVFVKYTSFM